MNSNMQADLGVLRVVPATDEIAVLCLEGEFDMDNAPAIIQESERVLADDKHLIIDLSATTFLDSYAITALFDVAAEAAKAQRVAVMQLGTAAIVERAVKLTQVDQALPHTKTLPEAIHTIEQIDRSTE